MFYFQNGNLDSCTANGYILCSIYNDGSSIAVNCSNADVAYTTEYSENYTGSFVNTYSAEIKQNSDSSAISMIGYLMVAAVVLVL